MNWLLGKIVGNPMILLLIVLAAFAAGGGAAWTVQGWRLAAVQAEYDGFVATVKAEGEAAAKLNAAQERRAKLDKENSDATIAKALAAERVAVKRLRDTRASIRTVPQTRPDSDGVIRACFDGAKLESATRKLVDRVSSGFESCTDTVIKLDGVKAWAALRMSDTLSPSK